MERRIPDNQPRIAIKKHLIEEGGHRHESRLASITLRQQNSGQSHRAAGPQIDRQGPDLPERPLRNQQNAPHRTLARNAEFRQIIETQPIQLRAGREADRRSPARERLRALRRQIEAKIEKPFLGTVQEAPNQRPCVEITDCGNAQTFSLANMPFPPPEVRAARAILAFKVPPALSPMRPLRFTVLFTLFSLLPAAAQITLNSTPTRAVGQLSTTLKSVNPNLVEGREFFEPEGIAIDTSTNPSPLYVADTGNNRILGFKNAAALTNGQFADIVIGQTDFSTTIPQGPNFTSRTTGLASPGGMAVDTAGNLYVVDTGNNRILRFPKPFTQSATVLPDMVIGQPNFTTGAVNQGGLSATSLNLTGAGSLVSIAFDASGNLWVADGGNNRILRFNVSNLGASPKSNPAADIVLGQGTFTVNSEGTSAPALTSFSQIFSPGGIVFDSAGRLFASETVSGRVGRVLVWFPASSGTPFSNGQIASKMLGVDQSTPPPPSVSQYQFGAPGALFAVGNQVGLSDTIEHRLLLFPPVEQWNLNNFYQAAIAEVGQQDFSGASANQGNQSPSASTLASPVGAAFFNSSLYVADAGNSRVLVLPQSGSGFGAATQVLGQVQFTLNSPNYIEGREFDFSAGGDAGVAIDNSSAVPHLYVADSYNNRILCFYDARTVQTGQYADIVIGQPDFLHSISNYPDNQPAQNNLSIPTGLVVDSLGNLYVADTGNGRVLRFPSPFANFQPGSPAPAMESADLVIGQLNYTTKITDATSQTMGAPYGLALSPHGLLVSDLANSRVLFFPGDPTTFTSSEIATIVFGQPSMTSTGAGAGLNQMNAPHHIAIDSDDRLYVADTGNGRVLIFNRAPEASNGAYAALTLTSGLTAPRGVNVNQATGDIWVADGAASAAVRYPNFNNLIGSGSYTPNAKLSDFEPLAVSEDNFGNVYIADNANRLLIYYPGMSALNAANYWGLATTPQFPLAPGTITALFTTGAFNEFGAATTSASTVPLPTQLNGLQVLVNNTPAPLFFAGPNQINFVVPSSAPTSGTADVQVVQLATGLVLGDTSVVMNAVSPGIFTQNATGSGDGVIANQDGTLNTSRNPAPAGSIITIYMTGQGYISGMPPDGNISNAALSTPFRPSVYIGGTTLVPDANITYTGLAPTLVGVWQLNVKIPNDVISTPTTPVQVFVQADSLVSGGGGLGRPVYVYVKAPQ